ncbi:MAG: hypothetical protein ACOYME_08810 [Prochlorotrichaceae cyanobacterium]
MFSFFSKEFWLEKPDRLRGLPPIVAVSILLALIAWNWQFTLAVGLGAIVTVLLYKAQLQPWQDYLQNWLQQFQTFLDSPQRALILSLLGGGLTAWGTYATTAVWQDLHSLWAASGFALEGIGLVILLGWLLLQGVLGNRQTQDQSIDQTLRIFMEPDPLQRLRGIHQADRLLHRSSLNVEQIQILLNGLTLLVQQEPIAEVRNAALDTLDRLESI